MIAEVWQASWHEKKHTHTMYIFQSMVVAIALCTHYMPIMLDF